MLQGTAPSRPCTSILSIGFLLLPLTTGFLSMAVLGLLLGFGNGLGSGIVITLGADFSPTRGRAECLGVWRRIGDVGAAGGPLLVGGVTAVAVLGPACLTVGAFGVAGAAFALVRMPETLRRGSAGGG